MAEGVAEEEEKVDDDIETLRGGIDLELTIQVHLNDENQVGRAALLLASTTTSDAENALKRELAQYGWRSVATEVGGLAGDLPQKVTRALVGASLNAGVVDKTRNEMHALMHAAVEALEGFLTVGMLEASVGAKIAIVRNERWIAVAVMGDTAYHAVAHHERCGLGVMHI
ncbi:MAG: HutP family protein [Aminobacterium sp.]|uniref:HutP family protein n=1 Tax=unclassified Aminobacterium TaxID=2685012 RepID=UPI0027DD93DC|nr:MULTISPECIES: HutP family protein [unclassified Aminobacterium]MDD2206534.1 HutP family protein [Aminobacterium sp.]MDD3426906.1 HutP family protein [Aminobacterium sp.]MDD3707025.1 HutP family protein [Aminobacterium sp.]MDD4228452.1 HutP family protein [Aminobacterium sp.]MDD4551375.1 HutP family protein [Aminobacterium sp.]